MIKIAVILTVYNRREVTLQGLGTLYKAIDYLQKKQPEANYKFDIYMTDDGCTDGTGDAVRKEFPEMHIIQGNGNLFWGGGMCKAWQYAVDTNISYDYFLWYNDDSELRSDALVTIFNDIKQTEGISILTGAFCDSQGYPSYGGKRLDRTVIKPSGSPVEVKLMNGNFVLIPQSVYRILDLIDIHFLHGFGDYDYGLRAQKNGIKVLLTSRYVGLAERHDELIPSYFSKDLTLRNRWRILHEPRNTPFISWRFNIQNIGIKTALLGFLRSYIYMLCPSLYYLNHKIK